MIVYLVRSLLCTQHTHFMCVVVSKYIPLIKNLKKERKRREEAINHNLSAYFNFSTNEHNKTKQNSKGRVSDTNKIINFFFSLFCI